MPVTLGYSALEGVLGMPDAIRLLEEVLTHEAAGRTLDPPKFSSDLDNGFVVTGRERVDDALNCSLVSEEVLAEPFGGNSTHVVCPAG